MHLKIMISRYYKVSATHPNLTDIYACCVCDATTVKKTLAEDFLMVALPEGDEEQHACLDGETELNNAQAKAEVCTDDWQDNTLP